MTEDGGSVLDEIIASATPSEREAKICVAGALNARFAALEDELEGLQQQRFGGSLGDVDPRRQIAEELERLREEMRQHEHTFTMRALEPKVWSDIRTEHGPRKDMAERFNADTLPPALVAASCVKIDGNEASLTVEKVLELFAVLNEGQRTKLFDAAWDANVDRGDVPFSALASAVLRSSEPK
jgi:hypothetical protein